MSFYDTYLKYKDFNFERLSQESGLPQVTDFAKLISPLAEEGLEEMAQKAHQETLKYFGKTIQLYTPLYLSNYCSNECLYCGFNVNNRIQRKKLSLEEVNNEARFIYGTGLRHVLILTGESRQESPVSYIKDCIKILKQYFSSISIEIYPLTEIEYAELIKAGADGLTIYQETYDQSVYEKVHASGPKRDYRFRLEAPERAALFGIRNINIGALLGLSDWRMDVFYLGLHAKYLQDNFPDIDISASLPRLRPQVGGFKSRHEISDTNFVQAILALRLFLPRLGITVSTRESPLLRENLLPLGVTRISAGSTTRVGGHTLGDIAEEDSCQFKIQDERTVEEIKLMLENKGYQAVLKDWMQF